MLDKRRRSPLAHREPLTTPDGRLALKERAFSGKVILRLSPDVKQVQDLNLPVTPNRKSDFDRAEILWLGPDEWMFLTPPEAEAEIMEKLMRQLENRHHQVVDVSDYYTVMQISGAHAPETLMKLTPFDIHPRAFKTGDVAGTLFGKAAGWIVNRSSGKPEFDIIMRWSMADYLWCLIAEAGREFGLPVQDPIGQVRGLRYRAK